MAEILNFNVERMALGYFKVGDEFLLSRKIDGNNNLISWPIDATHVFVRVSDMQEEVPVIQVIKFVEQKND